MSDGWDIPAAAVSVSEEIKKSRFITLLAHTDGVDAARSWIQSIKAAHPQARHHCWAFVAGAPDDSQQLGFSDDGEPAGTAGKPILAQLQGAEIGEISAVVVRYYGGIQLGTGGLVKAYGGGVQQALRQLTRAQRVPMRYFRLCCDYAQLSLVEGLVARCAGKVMESDFQSQITLTLALPYAEIAAFSRQLADGSRGGLQLQPLDVV
ncbi:IMPACT family protein [Pantoea sp. 1.19]|uniref:IMPACT family protein n=1 Tax=Pantoea sp. 1.19 TaxID=1925589 RepID=UPI0009491AB7|nr:IMPACT family protein [Pantoea sp. 1.19]